MDDRKEGDETMAKYGIICAGSVAAVVLVLSSTHFVMYSSLWPSLVHAR